MNSLGEVVYQSSIFDNYSAIFTEELPGGLYTVNIFDRGERIQTAKEILLK